MALLTPIFVGHSQYHQDYQSQHQISKITKHWCHFLFVIWIFFATMTMPSFLLVYLPFSLGKGTVLGHNHNEIPAVVAVKRLYTRHTLTCPDVFFPLSISFACLFCLFVLLFCWLGWFLGWLVSVEVHCYLPHLEKDPTVFWFVG